ncbi:MAG: DUF4380 domain-containing protein [Bacteroidales bacterium]|jgi:hypothetical protein|nr:DUF4380 domain-containing protein [Bacteroidales bacterium]
MESVHIEYIESKGVRLGVAPQIGGTLVFLSKHNSSNVINANQELLASSFRPNITPEADFYPYNGHTVWLGPQSAWWTQQNVNTERKKEASPWPPDPYIVYGEYEVVSKTAHTIVLRSPASPVWGVQIEKSFAINTDGSVFLSVLVQSVVDYPIAWDIWFNTRMRGLDRVYVPVREDDFKIEHVCNEWSTDMPAEYRDGFFTYTPIVPPSDKRERGSKTYVYPETPDIYAFSDDCMLHIFAEKYVPEQIHPEQGHIEIFNRTAHVESDGLLELEYHAPYKKLMPGESMQSWQLWDVSEYSGGNSPDEHIEMIQSFRK